MGEKGFQPLPDGRGSRFKIQKPNIFWREDFLEGECECNPSVLDPPSRSRTSPFAGGSETSEAPLLYFHSPNLLSMFSNNLVILSVVVLSNLIGVPL